MTMCMKEGGPVDLGRLAMAAILKQGNLLCPGRVSQDLVTLAKLQSSPFRYWLRSPSPAAEEPFLVSTGCCFLGAMACLGPGF